MGGFRWGVERSRLQPLVASLIIMILNSSLQRFG